MGYSKTGIISVSWVGAFRLFNRLANFLRTAILARLLSPAAFGNFGIAAIVVGFLEMLTETGINVFLIQQKGDSINKYVNTAWVTSIVRGTIISIIILLSTPFISSFFNNSASRPLIQLIALVPFIKGFINPSIVYFQKSLQFHKEVWFRISISLVDTLVAILVVYYQRTPDGLVWGLIAAASAEVVLSHYFITPRPMLMFRFPQFRSIIHSGKWITSAGILAYFSSKGSDIAIGKLVDSTALGLFQTSYRLAVVPMDEVIETINRVAFPIYSKIAHDQDRLRSAFIKNYLFIVAVGLAISSLIFIFARPIVLIILGNTWLQAIPILKLLSLIPILISLNAPANPLYLATQNQHYLTYTMGIKFLIMILTILPLMSLFGVSGAIYSIALSITAILPLNYFLVAKIIAHAKK